MLSRGVAAMNPQILSFDCDNPKLVWQRCPLVPVSERSGLCGPKLPIDVVRDIQSGVTDVGIIETHP